MSIVARSTTFKLGDRTVNRMGYGAMQLAGPGVCGPPKDHAAALAVLREAVARGVDHIDTSDFYGPHVTNKIIREALHPYSDNLAIVTKVGVRRGSDRSWNPAFSRDELTQAVHDKLAQDLGVDAIDVVNFRRYTSTRIHPAEGSLEAPIAVLSRPSTTGPCPSYWALAMSRRRKSRKLSGFARSFVDRTHYNLAHRDR